MANYNREILIPYLQNVCAIEMLCQKLEREKRCCEKNITLCREKINRTLSSEEKPNRESSMIIFACMVVCVICAIVIIVALLTWPEKPHILSWSYAWPYYEKRSDAIIKIVLAGAVFLIALLVAVGAMGNKKLEQEDYQKRLKTNALLRQENVNFKVNLQKSEAEIVKIKRHLRDAQSLRQGVYSVNIIPNRYRNIYAAYYLYDYFKTS